LTPSGQINSLAHLPQWTGWTKVYRWSRKGSRQSVTLAVDELNHAKTASKCLDQLTKDVTELANGIEQARSRKRLARK